MTFAFIEHENRVCDLCSRNFLSGLLHVDRGSVVAMLCYDCCGMPEERKLLQKLSKAKWIKQREAFER